MFCWHGQWRRGQKIMFAARVPSGGNLVDGFTARVKLADVLSCTGGAFPSILYFLCLKRLGVKKLCIFFGSNQFLLRDMIKIKISNYITDPTKGLNLEKV